MIEINSQRLLADLRQLATFGKVGTGVDRPAFSDADVSARRWLAGRMQEAKLAADIDRYGNVFGRPPPTSPAMEMYLAARRRPDALWSSAPTPIQCQRGAGWTARSASSMDSRLH